jgi:hypothetical protein
MSEYKMSERQKKHFAIIKLARARTVEFTESIGAPLVELTYVASFENFSRRIEPWFFYQTDEQIPICESNGTSGRLRDFLKQTLIELDYSFEAFPEVVFHFDSKQNLDANYHGSYFLRLR